MKFDEHLDFWSLDINSPGYVTSCLTEMLQIAFAVQPLIASNSYFLDLDINQMPQRNH